MRNKTLQLNILLSCLIFIDTMACASIQKEVLSQYQFADTKSLVQTVEAAAKLFHQEGTKAFPEFRRYGSKWFTHSRYLFIYNLQGKNIFHAAEPALQGKNIINFKDLNGRPVIKEMINLAKNEKPPYGWVHYLWTGPDHFFPAWKSSYVMAVTGPNGKAYFIGSGIYNMKAEKVFIKEAVHEIIGLLQTKGLNATLKILADKGSPYNFKNSYPFILDMKGVAIFDPTFPNKGRDAGVDRNMYLFKDAVGKHTIQTIIKKMKTQPSAWVMYMWPKQDQSQPARKAIYAHRVTINGKMLIVGSELLVETPIWMSD